MAKTSRSHEALQQLLDERTRYEQWLATLESKRASTPEHVYKRVHGDYEQRLAAVRDQLAERTGEIRSAISGLKERLKQTTDEETARVDELHEAELRALVGEFTPEQWELRKREVEVDLKRFVVEKKRISDELNQLLLIIEATTTNGGASGDAAPQPADGTVAAMQPLATDSPPASAPAGDTPAPEQRPAAAVPADATRVRSKTPARARGALHGSAASPPQSETPAVPIESLAPVDDLHAQAAPAGTPAPADPEGAEAAPHLEKNEAKHPHQAKRGKTTGFAHAPADARRENEKTLKCAECGAMNYPTEWYCESCGGELSAL